MNKDAAGVVGRILAVAAVLALPGLRDAVAAGPYDGTYHGTLTGGSMNALNCAKSAPTVIRAPVAADGSFSGSAQNMYATRGTPQIQTLNGKISGPSIQADTKVGNSCSYTLTLKKF